MSLSNFGEQFAGKVLRRFWQDAVTPSIVNTDYEGEIKKAGDRVNILSFLSDIRLSDYVAATDMDTESPVDAEDQLVVEKRKYYNFVIDRTEDLFTYAGDISDSLIENAAKTLERSIDAYVLEQAQYAKVGSWVGINLRVTGATTDTMASIATTATGGTLTVMGATVNGDAAVEDPTSGTLYTAGFTAADVGKPIRLTSGTTWATEWYRITGVNSTNSVSIENWDSATSGSDIPTGDVLRGLYGGEEYTSEKNGDGKPTTQTGWGWELQAAVPTTVSDTTIYDQIVEVSEKLNRQEIPDTDRHMTFPPSGISMLKRASEVQPAIAMAYEDVILNGKVAKVGNFEIHEAAGVRVSTRVGHATASGQGGDMSVTTSTANGTQILGHHKSFITFAYKWSESRVVDAENQFAKKYQGLHLYGAKVPALRRRSGALLFGTF